MKIARCTKITLNNLEVEVKHKEGNAESQQMWSFSFLMMVKLGRGKASNSKLINLTFGFWCEWRQCKHMKIEMCTDSSFWLCCRLQNVT